MERKRLLCFWVLIFSLFRVSANFADPTIGRLLDNALKSRNTGTVAEVSSNFTTAVNATTNPYQKSAIYSLFSEYLQDQGEWTKVVTLQQRILNLGDVSNRSGPLYNLVRANLELQDMESARAAGIQFQACPSADHLREYVQFMKDKFPHSIHSRIADLLQAIPVAPRPLLASANRPPPIDIHPPSVVFPKPLKHLPKFPDCRDASDEHLYSEFQDTASQHTVSMVPISYNRPKRVNIQLGAWNSKMNGSIVAKGMSLNLGSDVSAKSQTSPDLSVEYSLSAKDRLKVSYFDFSFTGTLSKSTAYNGKTYSPGASFELQTSLVDIGGFHELKRCSKYAWGFLYGAKLVNSTAHISQNSFGISRAGSWESKFGFPYFGLAATSKWGPNITLSAAAKFLSWGGNDQIHNHDLELKLLVGRNYIRKPAAMEWYGFFGYRQFRLGTSYEHESDVIRFSGPIFGLESHF